MWNRSYNVAMQTPIGVRYGTMTVSVNDKKIDGILDILKQANPFHGSKSENKYCWISGELTTLMHTIPFEGQGTISPDSVFLKLIAGKDSYDLSGSVSDISSTMEEVSAR